MNPNCPSEAYASCASANVNAPERACSIDKIFDHAFQMSMYERVYACYCTGAYGRYPANGGNCAVLIDQPAPAAGGSGGGSGPSTCGSVIRVDSLTLGELVPIIGTSHNLVYMSNRIAGRPIDYSLDIPITSNPRNAAVSQVDLTIKIAGRTLPYTFSSLTDGQTFTFDWDGKDSLGNYVNVPAALEVKLASHYTDGNTDIPTITNLSLGTWVVSPLGLGGWGIDVLHFYDPVSKKLMLGDGTSRQIADPLPFGSNTLIASADTAEAYEFSPAGRHLTTRFGLTGAIKLQFTYDSSGRLSSISDANGNTTSVLRSASGLITGIQSPWGQLTSVALNTDGYISSIQNPNTETFAMTYYGTSGLLQTFQKPRGQVSTFTYDTKGFLTSDVDSSGPQWSITWTPGSNSQSRNVAMTSAAGKNVYYSTFSDGSREGFQKNEAYSNTGSSVDHVNGSSSFDNWIQSYSSSSPDPRFGVHGSFFSSATEYPANSGVGKSWTRAKSVNLSTPTDPFSVATASDQYVENGKTTVTVYDGALKKFTTTSPGSRISTLIIDDKERPIETMLQGLTASQYTYNSFGDLTGISQGSRSTVLAYDSKHQLNSITNAASQASTMTYDNAGRV